MYVFPLFIGPQARLEASGRHSDMTYIPLNARVTHQEFVKLLLSKGNAKETALKTKIFCFQHM